MMDNQSTQQSSSPRRKEIRQAREQARAQGGDRPRPREKDKAQAPQALEDALKKKRGGKASGKAQLPEPLKQDVQPELEGKGKGQPAEAGAPAEQVDAACQLPPEGNIDQSLLLDIAPQTETDGIPKKKDQSLDVAAGEVAERAARAQGLRESRDGASRRERREGRNGERAQGRAARRKSAKVNYARAGKGRAQERQPAWWSVPVMCVALCALAAVTVFGGGALSRWQDFQGARAQVETGTFYPGITVDGVDVSSMTLDQALAAWEEKAQQSYQDCQLELEIDGETWLLTPEEMGYRADYQQVLTSAYSQGRYGTFAQRQAQVEKLSGAWSRNYVTHTGYDEEALLERLSQIATQVSQPAVEATISGFSEEGGFTFTQGEDGLVADPHDLLDAVEEAIAQGSDSVSVSRKTVSPGRDVEDLQSLFGQIAQAKTNARSSSQNRLTNLKLACQALNGLCIQPGETFSYNDTLGKRTTAKGYKSAPALSSGSHTMQVGGGICQVSTTLFNAVAKAGLEIVKRHPHSIPSSYVARGLDATVNWPNQDFKFKNTSDYPIYLSAKLNDQKQVVVAVYGRLLDDGVTIKLKGVTTNTYSPGEAEVVYTDKLPTGQKKWVSDRRTGYKVTTYRIYYKDGKETDREVLFKSTYASSAGKVQIGQ